jgi:hypothetical protein
MQTALLALQPVLDAGAVLHLKPIAREKKALGGKDSVGKVRTTRTPCLPHPAPVSLLPSHCLHCLKFSRRAAAQARGSQCLHRALTKMPSVVTPNELSRSSRAHVVHVETEKRWCMPPPPIRHCPSATEKRWCMPPPPPAIWRPHAATAVSRLQLALKGSAESGVREPPVMPCTRRCTCAIMSRLLLCLNHFRRPAVSRWSGARESKAQLRERVRRLMNELRSSPSAVIIVVGHSLFLRAMFAAYLNTDFAERHSSLAQQLTQSKVPNCGVVGCTFDYSRGPRMIVDAHCWSPGMTGKLAETSHGPAKPAKRIWGRASRVAPVA